MLPASFVMALLFCFNSSFANNELSPVFPQAVESFKQSDLAQSRESFLKILASQPNDPTLLYNLGLIENQDNHPGRALAYWRKALYASPGYEPALAGIASLKAKRLPALMDLPLFAPLYWRISSFYLCLICLLSFTLLGWLLVRYLSKKKLGLAISLVPLLSSSFAFIFFTYLCFDNYSQLHAQTKATVFEPQISVYSSPDDTSPSLFEFKEGDEVAVRRESAGWLQVQKSPTAVGWVKASQIFVHSGH